MCGIYGSINLHHNNDVIASKLACLNKRGPDFSQIKYFDDKVVLGHTRLAIIDLDARSNQPFEYLGIRIVFNGEIYNFQELRETLILQGYVFTTASDTEVICAAYLYWGFNCVLHLNGMFSFIIYDKEKRILFGGRDRLGKKPFFYNKENGSFEFSSQMAPLIKGSKLNLDQNKIADYLFWGHQPANTTVFKEIQKLPAGHYLVYNIDTTNLDIKQYWSLRYDREMLVEDSFDIAKENIKNILYDAVKIRLISDVPIGVFLSGGVDSSLVTAIAANVSSEKIRTFAVGFNEDDFDESRYAEQIAQSIGTNHTTIICDMDEAKELITNYTHYIDEPFADASTIPSMLLSKHTKKHVTVALTGDGGDELFLGYSRYNWMSKISLMYKLPAGVRTLVSKFIKLNPSYRAQIIALALKAKSVDELYINLMGTFKKDWFSYEETALNPYISELRSYQKVNLVEKLSDFEIKYYLNDDINTKVDRASMAFSLETRAPLMDYRLYEYGKKLETKYKFHKSEQKILLKSLLADMVNPSLFDRPKTGFAMPLKHWFRSDLKDFVYQVLTGNEIDKVECLSRASVVKLFEQHVSGSHNHSVEIWRLIVLFKWLEVYG